TRTEIGYDHGRQNAQQQVPERLPGTAGTIHAVKSPGDLVEIKLRLLAAAADDALEIDLITGMLGQFRGAANGQSDKLASRGVGVRIQFIECALALAPRLHQT